MRPLVLAGAVLALGCAGSIMRSRLGREPTPDEGAFVKRGMWTAEDLEQDRSDCKRQVRRQTVDDDPTYPMHPGSTEDSLRRFKACMATLGWTAVTP